MAEQLGISASYLNLLEHNQRPVTVPVLLRLAQTFQIDLQDLAGDDEQQLHSDLMEVFADPLFEGHELGTPDLRDLVSSLPQFGRAVLTLYQAYRGGRAQTEAALAIEDTERMPVGMPSEEVGDFLQERGNHFRELEAAAEEIRAAARMDRHLPFAALAAYLGQSLAVDVDIRPARDLAGALRVYDPRSHRLTLSELLPQPSRNFQLAYQVGHLTQRALIERVAAGGKFTTAEADALARIALANYLAAAILMPYGAFLDAARECRHDIEVLERRFNASFEQVCHRLTTLQRPGAQGIPFHLIRVDIAGNVAKRFSASGIALPRFSGACPRWNVYDAFATPGLIRTQLSRMPDGSTYFCIARTVQAVGRSSPRGFYLASNGRHAIGLGCQASHAKDVVYADGLDLANPQAVIPIGVSCRVCERVDCVDRAFPSVHHALAVDANRRGVSPFAPRDPG